MKALSINIILATIWLMLTPDISVTSFFIGYVIGFAILYLFPDLVHAQSYIKRTIGLLRFLFIFLWSFIKSNLTVANIVLFIPKNQLHPSFLEYDISSLSKSEALLLSQLITLTPGTISVQLLDHHKTLLIHVLDMRHPSEVYASIDKELKEPILRFTRS